jgi:hypothetical protein
LRQRARSPDLRQEAAVRRILKAEARGVMEKMEKKIVALPSCPFSSALWLQAF